MNDDIGGNGRSRARTPLALPARVRVVEVGPRDGLQNEPDFVPTTIKRELIARLVSAGLRTIEATAFVAPKRVPQMADAAQLLQSLDRVPGIAYPVLTPNLTGFDAALAAGATEVAVFTAASESFSQRNVNCSIAASLARFAPVMEAARRAGVRVRGYVSCVLGCPYEGAVAPERVRDVASALYESGCHEVSLGDTIGVGTPVATQRLIECVATRIPVEHLAGHFHDTYGMAIANVFAALQCGVGVFDASVAGLGGCPYAPGASGNVATEDLAYLLAGLGIDSGIDLDALIDCAVWISAQLGRQPASHITLARRRSRPGV